MDLASVIKTTQINVDEVFRVVLGLLLISSSKMVEDVCVPIGFSPISQEKSTTAIMFDE